MHRYNQRGWRGSGLEGQTLPLHPCGQLTRCFSAVAELLVLFCGFFRSFMVQHGILREFPNDVLWFTVAKVELWLRHISDYEGTVLRLLCLSK